MYPAVCLFRGRFEPFPCGRATYCLCKIATSSGRHAIPLTTSTVSQTHRLAVGEGVGVDVSVGVSVGGGVSVSVDVGVGVGIATVENSWALAVVVLTRNSPPWATRMALYLCPYTPVTLPSRAELV